MSYHVWSTNGYGICTDGINTTEERLLQLIKMAPSFAAGYIEWAESTNGEGEFIEEATLEELLEWEDDYGYVGLAPIMRAVLEEKENICFVVAENFNGVQYLLFEPFYPWSVVSPEENDATKEGIAEILRKYVRVLTDEPIDVEYYSVENGG